jgi:hypothetical protein
VPRSILDQSFYIIDSVFTLIGAPRPSRVARSRLLREIEPSWRHQPIPKSGARLTIPREASPTTQWQGSVITPPTDELVAFAETVYGEGIAQGLILEDIAELDPVFYAHLAFDPEARSRLRLRTMQELVGDCLYASVNLIEFLERPIGHACLVAAMACQPKSLRVGVAAVSSSAEFKRANPLRPEPAIADAISVQIAAILLSMLPDWQEDETRLAPPAVAWKDHAKDPRFAAASLPVFLRRVYADRLGRGFTKSDLRMVDQDLANALDGFARSSSPSGRGRVRSLLADIELPTRSEWYDRHQRALRPSELVKNSALRPLIVAAANRMYPC